MALPQLVQSLDIHQGLQDQPNSEYTAEQLKVIFDQAPNTIKTYLNETLLPALDALLADIDTTSQVGKVDWFATTTAPTGWLICDGSAVSRTTYSRLFTKVGTLWGAGDGATTFNLPNAVTGNRFPRAAGGSVSVGTTQEDAIKSHDVNVPYGSGGAYLSGDRALQGYYQKVGDIVGHYVGDTETRPKSIAFLCCIRY